MVWVPYVAEGDGKVYSSVQASEVGLEGGERPRGHFLKSERLLEDQDVTTGDLRVAQRLVGTAELNQVGFDLKTRRGVAFTSGTRSGGLSELRMVACPTYLHK